MGQLGALFHCPKSKIDDHKCLDKKLTWKLNKYVQKYNNETFETNKILPLQRLIQGVFFSITQIDLCYLVAIVEFKVDVERQQQQQRKKEKNSNGFRLVFCVCV